MVNINCKIKRTSLYPTTIFHFTTKKNFYSIIENFAFKPSYASEEIFGKLKNRRLGVPMVSFCDLKLSELKHFKSYGNFGIGLSKRWANEKGLNPVFYVNNNCQMVDDFIDGVEEIKNDVIRPLDVMRNDIVDRYNRYMKIFNTFRYIKNYEGPTNRKHNPNKEEIFRFADEREWRFVPSIDSENIRPFLDVALLEGNNKRVYNNKIKQIKLEFAPTDVQFLIVKNEEDISELVNHLKKMINIPKDIDLLTSRILTENQIDNDI